MPFQADDFYNPQKVVTKKDGTATNKSAFMKQTDKFLATLSHGFGKAAGAVD